MKNSKKINRIFKGLLVLVLVVGMLWGNEVTAGATGSTTYHFCGFNGGNHANRPVEGTILYQGDVLEYSIYDDYDDWVYTLFVDNVETQGVAVGSLLDNELYEWTADATYVVTRISEIDEGDVNHTDIRGEIYLEKWIETSVEEDTVPAWLLAFNEDYAQMLKDISEAESGANVEIDATVWHSFSAKQLEELMQRSDVNLVFTYAYEGEKFKVTIPAGTEMIYDCEWYGPLKLNALFGRTMISEAE